jgi:hypothetical protein
MRVDGKIPIRGGTVDILLVTGCEVSLWLLVEQFASSDLQQRPFPGLAVYQSGQY